MNSAETLAHSQLIQDYEDLVKKYEELEAINASLESEFHDVCQDLKAALEREARRVM